MVLYSTHRNINDAIESIQCSVNKVHEYLRYRNLEVSSHKSSWMGFTQDNAIKISLNLTINENIFPTVHSHHSLGGGRIILDYNLKGRHHLRYTKVGEFLASYQLYQMLFLPSWSPSQCLQDPFHNAGEYRCQFFNWNSSRFC